VAGKEDMKVLIIDIDSKIPNLALKKIEKYHLDKGDGVIWHNKLLYGQVEKTYVSVIFKQNRWKAEQFNNAVKGGSGWDLVTKLPPEIDKIKPHINLGFTTRGCFRKCPFCIVWEKEGELKIEGDLLDLWDGKSRNVVLLDNNILGIREQFLLVCKQARENKIRVDFNQGLDHRLLTKDIVKELKSISHIEYRFAFDHPSSFSSVERAIDLLQKEGINRCSWYVLVGFNTTLEEDIKRLNYLRERNQNAYVQRYIMQPQYIPLARWANQHHIFQAMDWTHFINRKENRKYLIYFFSKSPTTDKEGRDEKSKYNNNY